MRTDEEKGSQGRSLIPESEVNVDGHVATGHAGLCPNCGSSATGDFCMSCGQSQGELILSTAAWFRSVAQDLSDLDGAFLRTLRALLRRPGRVTEAWIEGRRASFISPVRLYLLSSALLFGILALPGLSVVGRDAVEGGLTGFIAPSSPPQDADAPAGLVALARDEEALERIAITVTENLPRAMFLLLPFAALLLKALVPRQPYVVHMVWSLHVHAALYLGFVALVLAHPLRGTAKYVLAYPLATAVLIWACWYVVAAFSRVHERSFVHSLVSLGVAGAVYVPVFGLTVILISALALQ